MVYLYITLGLLALLFARLWIGLRRGRKRYSQWVERVNEAHSRSFQNSPVPQLKIGSSYGFSTFNLMFDSREDHQRAADAGAIERFMDEIQVICVHEGREGNPFNARSAVFCTDPLREQSLEVWGSKMRADHEREKQKRDA
jgi:hypothetical protein